MLDRSGPEWDRSKPLEQQTGWPAHAVDPAGADAPEWHGAQRRATMTRTSANDAFAPAAPSPPRGAVTSASATIAAAAPGRSHASGPASPLPPPCPSRPRASTGIQTRAQLHHGVVQLPDEVSRQALLDQLGGREVLQPQLDQRGSPVDRGARDLEVVDESVQDHFSFTRSSSVAGSSP